MRIKIRIKKSKRLTGLTARRSLIAMGTLAAYAATNGTASLAAQTPTGAASGTPPSGRGLVVVRFDIPASALSEEIAEFERISGWKIAIPDEKMQSVPATGISGVLPAEQALNQLLEGTGLRYRMTGAMQATLFIEEVRSTVEVNERAPLSSPRYTEPLRDLPQTITVIPRSIIEQQGSTTLTDVLRNVPGLTITAGEGGGAPAGDNLTLRGNSARNDIFVDGVRDVSPQSRDPFNLEQVEVTKGPTSAITGRGSAGGTINLLSKTPTLNRVVGGSLALGNADAARHAGHKQFVKASGPE
ncbi:MAG: TonB-dependent receptor plug domain-containing protein [Bryobacterales bacterium]|nr:TonB-dependent receptor plug domain-containing protein [Bryobacterales bacterium]